MIVFNHCKHLLELFDKIPYLFHSNICIFLEYLPGIAAWLLLYVMSSAFSLLQPNYVGIICVNFSPKKLIERKADSAR